MTKQHGWGPSAGPVPALQWGQCKNVRTVFLTCHPPATTDWSGTHSGVQASPKLIIFLPPSLKCWDYRCELSCWFGPILFAAPKNISFPSSHCISEWYSGRHTAQESVLLCKTAQVRKESHSSFDLGCLHLKKQFSSLYHLVTMIMTLVKCFQSIVRLITQNWNLLIFIRKTNAHVLPVRTESLSWMLPSSVVPSSQQVIRWWHPRRAWGGGNLDCFQSQNSILRLLNEGGLSDSFQGGPAAPERNAAWWAGVKYQLTVLLGTRAGPSIKYHFRKKTYLPTCWQFISRWGLTPAPRAVTSIFPLWNCRQLVCGGSARPINIYTFYSHSSQSI